MNHKADFGESRVFLCLTVLIEVIEGFLTAQADSKQSCVSRRQDSSEREGGRAEARWVGGRDV